LVSALHRVQDDVFDDIKNSVSLYHGARGDHVTKVDRTNFDKVDNKEFVFMAGKTKYYTAINVNTGNKDIWTTLFDKKQIEPYLRSGSKVSISTWTRVGKGKKAWWQDNTHKDIVITPTFKAPIYDGTQYASKAQWNGNSMQEHSKIAFTELKITQTGMYVYVVVISIHHQKRF